LAFDLGIEDGTPAGLPPSAILASRGRETRVNFGHVNEKKLAEV